MAVGVRAQDLYYEAYDRGIQAYQARNWTTARQLFERALQLDSRQSRNKRFVGMRFGLYIPQYYLALIAVEQKRYPEALALFDAVQRAGLVRTGDSEYKTLTAQRALAEAAVKVGTVAEKPDEPRPSSPRELPSPPRPEPAKPAAEEPPPSKPAVEANAGAAKPPDRPAVPPPAPANTTPTREPPAAPPSATVATPPPTAPNTAPAEVQRLSTEATRSLQAGAFERAWVTAGRLAALPQGGTLANDIRTAIRIRALETGQQHLSKNDVAGATAVSATLSKLAPSSAEADRLRTLIVRRREDDVLERAALKNLLLGDYQKVIDLAAPRLQNSQASARLVFYAACSRAGLALNAPADRRAALTEEARRLYQQALQLGGAFTREEPFISPAILGSLAGRPS